MKTGGKILKSEENKQKTVVRFTLVFVFFLMFPQLSLNSNLISIKHVCGTPYIVISSIFIQREICSCHIWHIFLFFNKKVYFHGEKTYWEYETDKG